MPLPHIFSVVLLLLAGLALGDNSIATDTGRVEFDNVLDLRDNVRNERVLKLHYTLKADGTLRGALVAKISASEFAGISFGRAHRSTSPTVIATSSFVDGYFLNSFSTIACNAARGTWSISGVKLEYMGQLGQVVAQFTGTGIRGGTQTIGYAIGPYSGGSLGDHTRGVYGSMYNNMQATLLVSADSAPGPPPPPPGSPAAPPPPPQADWRQGIVKDSLSMVQWINGPARDNWPLMMAFCVSWVSGLGVLLLLWPFVFDAAADLCSLVARRGRAPSNVLYAPGIRPPKVNMRANTHSPVHVQTVLGNNPLYDQPNS